MTQPSIGFILHPGEAHIVRRIADHAEARGWTTWSAISAVDAAVAENAESTRLLVTVGGDGTFLLGARLAAPRSIPVMGVNRGRLGFLTDVEVADLPAAIEAFIAGDCVRQRRSLLHATAARGTTRFDAIALNDVVVKSRGVSVARLRVDVDGELLGEFDADGVVITTATGSTAYALSAGGPPIDPRVRAIAVVPLAPHAVMTRAVVLPEAVTLHVTVERGRVVAAADGHREVGLAEGTVLTVAPGPELQVVHPPGYPSFQQRLHDKLRFGTPLKERERPRHNSDEASA